jgi:hypothetical protein
MTTIQNIGNCIIYMHIPSLLSISSRNQYIIEKGMTSCILELQVSHLLVNSLYRLPTSCQPPFSTYTLIIPFSSSAQLPSTKPHNILILLQTNAITNIYPLWSHFNQRIRTRSQPSICRNPQHLCYVDKIHYLLTIPYDTLRCVSILYSSLRSLHRASVCHTRQSFNR